MKKKALGYLVILLIGVLFFFPSFTYSFYTGKDASQPAGSEFSPTRLIVRLKPRANKKVTLGKVQGRITTGLAQLDSLNLKFEVNKQERLFKEFKETALKFDKFFSVYILEVPEGTDLIRMKREYQNLPEVEYVELDYKLELFDVPNDPLFKHQWYLNNVGQGYLGINRIPGDYNDTQIIKYGTEDADIDALQAIERGNEITVPLVGIIDTGVDLDHLDLSDNIWTNPGEIPDNGTDDDHNGFVDDFYGWDFAGSTLDPIQEDNDPTDTYGHGTHCVGIVAARRDNQKGVSGINSPCKIMAIKMFPDYLGGTFLSLGAKSIIYAADMECDVINMSWGGPYPSKVIEDALDYAIYRGVLPIAAAGNSGAEDKFYPASLPQVFTAGASNSDDEVTHFSSYGDHIEVVAPGEDVLSLRADDTDMYATGAASGIEPNVHIVDDLYYLADGTSMASPCVVGVAAYILAVSPGISKDSVKEIIQRSADDIIYPYGGDSLYSPGKDIYSGYGRVNLNSALELLSGRLAKIDYPYENTLVSGDVAIVGTASGDSFENYVLEYGEGYTPEEWTEIASSDIPISKDTLGIWNSAGLTGPYALRLTVGDQNQAVVHLIANNDNYVKITSPSDGDTVLGHVEIYGYTVVSDFSHYTLEYGYGESPSVWIPIITSTKMVADHMLGTWLVSYFEEMYYSIRLTVETNGSETYADTVVVLVRSPASGGWVQELSTCGSLSPAVGDIDGDGSDEVVVGIGGPAGYGFAGGIEVFSHEGEREPGWPRHTDKNMMSSPALGDLDGDGIDDIVICSEQAGMHALLSSSNDWNREVWTGGNGLFGLSTPLITDLEDDGYLEVLAVNDEGTVYAWRNDGQSVIPGRDGLFAQTVGSSWMGFPCLAVADLDKDGENEVIAGVARGACPPSPSWAEGGIYIWDTEGNLLLAPGDYPDQFVCVYGIAIANVDENKDLEIITFGADTSDVTLSAFKKDGTQPANYPIVLEDLNCQWFGNHPAIGDVEGDGILEIVVSVWAIGEARIYAWHQDGTPLGTIPSEGLLVSMKSPDAERKRELPSALGNGPVEIVTKIRSMSTEELAVSVLTYDDPVFASVPETFGSPILSDVNGDGNVDIVARAGYLIDIGFERVYAWDYSGNLVPGWPLHASDQQTFYTYNPFTPVIADMDKDSNFEMIVLTDNNIYTTPKVICWEFDTYDDATQWPKYMHDKWNSGGYGFEPREGLNLPPQNFRVETWNENGVTLAWTPKTPRVSLGYNIYRTTIPGEPGAKINADLIAPPDSQYQDLGLIGGQTYYYTITNVDTNHQESGPSPQVWIHIGQPSAPHGLAARQQGCDIKLNWRANPEAESVARYKIFRKEARDTAYELINSVIADTTYLDTLIARLGVHAYHATAVSDSGLESFASPPAHVDFKVDAYPPSDFRISSWFGTEITLSWSSSGTDEYNIYRSTTAGRYGDSAINSAPIGDTTYQDAGLTEGVTYYYVAAGIGECNAESRFSAEVEFLAGRPQAPTGLSGDVHDCHIQLHWNPSPEGDVLRYGIYEKILSEPDYVLIGSVENDTIFIDPAADDSLNHSYTVTAVDSLGLESLPSHYIGVSGPLYPPRPPFEFHMTSYADTSIAFRIHSGQVQGYNVYGSPNSSEYDGPPINPAPISCEPRPDGRWAGQHVYYPGELTDGQSLFFNATCIKENECGKTESGMDDSLEITFIAGVPQAPTGLSVYLDDRCRAVLSWRPNSEEDAAMYRIYHKTDYYSPDSLFLVEDSVFAPETTYVDSSINGTLDHCYALQAVDTLGLASPVAGEACVWLEALDPWWVLVADWTDTSATLWSMMYPGYAENVIGCNFYRSLVPNEYTGLEPINDTLITPDSTGRARHTDFGLTEGTTYYYTATTVNKCGVESEACPRDPWLDYWVEDSILMGRPNVPGLQVKSCRTNIELYMFSSDTDIRRYKIFRRENDGPFQIIDSLCLDTLYIDSSAAGGTIYGYKVTAIDTLGLESFPSSEVEGCVMAFDQGVLLVDITYGSGCVGVNGDSVDAFYERALEGYDYTDFAAAPGEHLRLIDLSSHPIVILHSEDERANYSVSRDTYQVLKQYLAAGGALFIEGRRNLSQGGLDVDGGFRDFVPGYFESDNLNIDSAYVPPWSPSYERSEEFIGARGTAESQGYPETVELDTFRVNHSFDPLSVDLDGKLPGVGYFVSLDSTDVIYTFVSAYDTSASSGKPVALKHFTNDFAVIYLDFPLYFVKEDIAIQILHKAISDFTRFIEGEEVKDEEIQVPASFWVSQNYPNPFNPQTAIQYALRHDCKVELTIYNILGQKIKTLINRYEKAGHKRVEWNGRNDKGEEVASGVYFYKIEAGKFTQSKKMVILK